MITLLVMIECRRTSACSATTAPSEPNSEGKSGKSIANRRACVQYLGGNGMRQVRVATVYLHQQTDQVHAASGASDPKVGPRLAPSYVICDRGISPGRWTPRIHSREEKGGTRDR